MKSEGKITAGSGPDTQTNKPPAVREYDLEERLLEFASVVIDVSDKLPDTRPGNHLAGQLLRSGTSPYGNHGEAQSSDAPPNQNLG